MILITGNKGYIGSVMTGFFNKYGLDVVGVDTDYYNQCDLCQKTTTPQKQIIKDIRNIEKNDLADDQSSG